MAHAEISDTCPPPDKRAGGAWLDSAGLRKCLETAKMLDLSQQEVHILNEELKHSIDQTRALQESLRISAQEIDLTKSEMARNDAAVAALKHDLEAWYRSPWVVGTLGVLTGAATMTAVLFVVTYHP